MMDKNEIKLLRAFLIESKMTQKEFAKEASISERTLYTAIKTGKVSDITYNKILTTMLDETKQREMLQSENILSLSDLENTELTNARVLSDIILLLLGIMAILGTFLLLR